MEAIRGDLQHRGSWRGWPRSVPPAASFLEDIQASSCRHAGKEALLDDRVDAPITIDHLRDTEINPDGHERNRLILGEPLGGHQEDPHLAECIPQREIDRGF
jgi:hypothetical protein